MKIRASRLKIKDNKNRYKKARIYFYFLAFLLVALKKG